MDMKHLLSKLDSIGQKKTKVESTEDMKKFVSIVKDFSKPVQGVAEGSEPKLGTIKANLMNTEKPTVQVQVFKHNTLRGDSYWVTKEVKTFKTMDQAQAYVDRINKQGVSENSESEIAALYIDEFGDGDHWYVKGSQETIKRFVQLANSLEDETVKGTDYEPGVGGMAQIHKQLGNDQPPQWQIVAAKNLEQLKPIDNKTLASLSRADLSNGAQEFMTDLLWNLESNNQALVHSDSEKATSESLGLSFKDYLNLVEAKKKITASEDPCWKGYKMVGTKKKGGREVPNCVPGKKGD